MRDSKKTNRFKDDIRRTFTAYALLPTAILTVVIAGLIAAYWVTSVCGRNADTRVAVCEEMNRLVTAYTQKTIEIAALCDPVQLAADKKAQRILSEQLYEFTNHTPGQSDFYVFDDRMNLLVSSAITPPAFARLESGASWGVTARMRRDPTRTASDFINKPGEHGRPMDLAIGKAVTTDGIVSGYIAFVIPGYYFLSFTENLPTHILVTDRYHYTRIANDDAFSDQLGRLDARILAAKQYTTLGHEQYYLTKQSILDGEMTVYALSPVSATITSFTIAGVILFVMLVIVLFAIVFGARRLAADKTKIIDQLVEAFSNVREGNLDTHLAITSNDEFELIGDSYNIMLASIKELIHTSSEKARKTVISEIKQLESQFNPHFLFNTMENIKFMVKLDPDAATRMIVLLSTLLRYSINTDSTEVTIEEDIEYTQSYLDILKYRFGARLDYLLDIPPDALDCVIPKLIIEPIIENAVKYGFVGRQHLHMEMHVQLTSDTMLLTIYNDGTPMDEHTLAEVRAQLARVQRVNHIGLYNTHRRIRLMYGEAYGLEVESGQGQGTTVKLTLPIIHREVPTC